MAQMNALIPLGVKPFDLGNSLAKGVAIGNSLIGNSTEDDIRRAQAEYYRQRANSPEASSTVYGTPVFGTDSVTGKEGVGVIGKDGQFRVLDTGNFQPSRGVQFLNRGDVFTPANKSTGAPIGQDLPISGAPPTGFQPGSQGQPGTYMPGSEPALKQQRAEESAAQNANLQQRTADVVTEDIDRIKSLVQGAIIPATGMSGAVFSNVPNTSAHNVANLLNTIKANIGFDKLQQMRAASPTGGALGQVSERENTLLQSTYGALEQSQTEEQFLYNLDRLQKVYNQVVHGTGGQPAPPAPPQQAQSQQYREGMTATGPGGQRIIFQNGQWVPMQ